MASPLEESAGDNNQQTRISVAKSYSGSGDSNTEMPYKMREIYFNCDESSILTISGVDEGVAWNLTFSLRAMAEFDERFQEFNNVDVRTSGNWMFYTRSGRIK